VLSPVDENRARIPHCFVGLSRSVSFGRFFYNVFGPQSFPSSTMAGAWKRMRAVERRRIENGPDTVPRSVSGAFGYDAVAVKANDQKP